jgi:hypothetical protein
MTQAKDFPPITSTIATDTFISDNGVSTNKSTIDKIKNIFNFMIGSCVLLNETENEVYDINNIRKITYLRLDKISMTAKGGTTYSVVNNGTKSKAGYFLIDARNGF